jgi:hypothetical protein
LECEGTNEWRKMTSEERIWNLAGIIGIQKLAPGRNAENWHIIGAYISKFEEKWDRVLKKYQVECVT